MSLEAKTPPPYFSTLSDLSRYFSRTRSRVEGIQKYHPRPFSTLDGKLLVCHDYKGGYKENPCQPSYTFNFWSLCDTFIYFSHHLVTPPPFEWVNIAHRQGVKILGTLILEHREAMPHVTSLLRGDGPLSAEEYALPSMVYIDHLVSLALERGFDGYLLNIECPLPEGEADVRHLVRWISLFKSQLVQAIGPHAQLIWYDSVITSGDLLWQDRLCDLNFPFFNASSAIFTNYTWPTHYPAESGVYLDAHVESPGPDNSVVGAIVKSRQDIFCGVDMWGRGSYGGGGFGAYKAISCIDPRRSKLSVALFGQPWSWETEEEKPGFTWEKWWKHEQGLWLGSKNDLFQMSDSPLDPLQSVPGAFSSQPVPLKAYFHSSPPPIPTLIPFAITFSPGVGFASFVEGKRVTDAHDAGWTDINKQTSLGDLVWPVPRVFRTLESCQDSEQPFPLKDVESSVSLSFHDAWTGGSSLFVQLSSSNDFFSVGDVSLLCMPINSIALPAAILFTVSVVYKISSSAEFVLEPWITSRTLHPLPVILQSKENLPLPSGWCRTAYDFAIDDQVKQMPAISDALVGVVIRRADGSTSAIATISFHVGHLSIAPVSLHIQSTPQ